MAKPKLIGLAGQAGSGKDTVCDYLTKTYSGVKVAQADPIKNFAAQVFNFSQEQLWGPSEKRNAKDERYAYPTQELLDGLEARFQTYAKPWLKEVLPNCGWWQRRKAYKLFESILYQILGDIGRGEGITPRKVLMLWGTEAGRAFREDMWVDYMISSAKEMTTGLPGILVHFATASDVRFLSEIRAIRKAGGVVFKIIRPSSTLSAEAESAGIKGHVSEQELNTIAEWEYDEIIYNTGTLEDLYERVSTLAAKWGLV